jgi:hypothetical protein
VMMMADDVDDVDDSDLPRLRFHLLLHMFGRLFP